MKHLLKQLLPPAVFSSLKYAKNKLIPRKSTASLTQVITVTGGPLQGAQLLLDPTGPWQKDMISGDYDSFFFTALSKIPKDDIRGKVILDVGGHIGYHALAFAKYVGEKGKVFVFEPNPTNFERLEKNLSLNPTIAKNITAEKYAVSDKRGEEDFIFSTRIENGASSGSFLDRSETFWEKSVYEKNIGFLRKKTPTVSLDEWCAEKNVHPFVIKIDVEGAEYLVVQGMKKILSIDKPILFIEIHSIFAMYSVNDFLSKMHYTLELIEKNKDGRCFFIARPL